MAQINKPSDYFNTKLYSGTTNSSDSITGVGFQPDLVWLKSRTNAGFHWWTDAVRGATKTIHSNLTNAEATNSDGLTSFDSDGFTIGNNSDINGSGKTFVAWNWLGANGTASNTDGTITSTVSANTTSGFSIVSYSGNSSASTVGHGLGVAPSVVLVKNRTNGTHQWTMFHKSLAVTDVLFLDTTGATFNPGDNDFQDTAPTSSVFSITSADGRVNGSSHTFIAYCFAEKKGFSKFGSYTGNGNADGTFVYTGFKPAMVIVKRTDTTANWVMFDNKRNSFNLVNNYLLPDSNVTEGSFNAFDFVSNGLKIRGTDAGNNASGASYIYMAFAESPLVGTNNIPAVAR